MENDFNLSFILDEDNRSFRDKSGNVFTNTTNYFEERLEKQISDTKASKIRQDSDNASSQLQNIEEYLEEGKIKVQEKEKCLQNCQGYIIIVGNTGIGKTTSANYMCGFDMKYTEIRPGKFAFIGGEGIGNTSLSCTVTPNILRYHDSLLIDCPGLNDNRGQVQDIINAFFTKFILDNNKKKKFIVAISYNIMQDSRLVELIELARNITNLLGDIDTYKNSLIFEFTMVLEGATVEQIKEDISELLKTNQSLKEEREFLTYLSSKQSKIYLFYRPASNDKSMQTHLFPITKQVIDSVKFTTEVIPTITIAPRSLLMVKKFYEVLQQKLLTINNTIFFQNIYPKLANVNQQQSSNQNSNEIVDYIKSLVTVEKCLEGFHYLYTRLKNAKDKTQIFTQFEQLITNINTNLNLNIQFETIFEQMRKTKELIQFTQEIDSSTKEKSLTPDFTNNILLLKEDVKSQKMDIIFSVRKYLQKQLDIAIESTLKNIQKQIKDINEINLQKIYSFFKAFSKIIKSFEAECRQKDKTKLQLITDTLERIQKNVIQEYNLQSDLIEIAKELIEQLKIFQQLESTVDVDLEVFHMCLQEVKQEYEGIVRVKIQELLKEIQDVLTGTNIDLKMYYAELVQTIIPSSYPPQDENEQDQSDLVTKFRNFYNIFKEYSTAEKQSQNRSIVARQELLRLCKTIVNNTTFDQSGVQTLGYALRLVRLIYENLPKEKQKTNKNPNDIEKIFSQNISNIMDIINDSEIPKSINELITYKDVEQITESLQKTVEESLKNYESVFRRFLNDISRVITTSMKESINEMESMQNLGSWMKQVRLYRFYSLQPSLYSYKESYIEYIQELMDNCQKQSLNFKKEPFEKTIKYTKILSHEIEKDKMQNEKVKETYFRNIFQPHIKNIEKQRVSLYQKLDCFQRILIKF